MSHLLTEPRTVLAAGFEEPTLEELRDVLLDGTARQVERASVDATETDGSLGTLAAERSDVGCVLVGGEGETDPVHVGLVVCSYRPNTRCTGVFDNVSVRRLAVD